MVKQQLELSLTGHTIAKPAKPAAAQWWFEKMRQVVNQACERTPTGPLPAEQSWLNRSSSRRRPLDLTRKMVLAR